MRKRIKARATAIPFFFTSTKSNIGGFVMMSQCHINMDTISLPTRRQCLISWRKRSAALFLSLLKRKRRKKMLLPLGEVPLTGKFRIHIAQLVFSSKLTGLCTLAEPEVPPA